MAGVPAALEADRAYRQRATGPGLYESEDLPRLARLREASDEARRLRRAVRLARRSGPLRGLRAEWGPLETPVFAHVGPYRRARDAFHRYLHSSLVLLEGGREERLKPRSAPCR